MAVGCVQKAEKAEDEHPIVKRDVSFSSDGEVLRGWLFLPADVKPGTKVPGIVTANAFSGVKEINVAQYSERFAEAGFAALAFDYRYWGASSGEPRHHIAPVEHRADISNALSYLAGLPEVDSDRIGGWGISMGGGHMLYLATWEPRFKAIVAVSAGLSTPSMDKKTLMTILAQDPKVLTFAEAKARNERMIASAKKEAAGRAKAGLKQMQCWCEKPTEGCAAPVREAYDYYMEAKGSYAPTFENMLTSTSFPNMAADDNSFAPEYSRSAVLIIHPDKDLIPVEAVLAFYERLPEPKHLIVPAGLHTITYANRGYFEISADEAIAWFNRYLKNR